MAGGASVASEEVGDPRRAALGVGRGAWAAGAASLGVADRPDDGVAGLGGRREKGVLVGAAARLGRQAFVFFASAFRRPAGFSAALGDEAAVLLAAGSADAASAGTEAVSALWRLSFA